MEPDNRGVGMIANRAETMQMLRDCGFSLAAIGIQFGITRERVRQLTRRPLFYCRFCGEPLVGWQRFFCSHSHYLKRHRQNMIPEQRLKEKQRKAKYYQAHREEMREYSRQYWKNRTPEQKAKDAARATAWSIAHPEKRKQYMRNYRQRKEAADAGGEAPAT